MAMWGMRVMPSSMAAGALPIMAHLVDADRRGQDQGVVLTRLDLDPVRIAGAEPALGHLRYLLAIALEVVVVVHDVPLDLVLAARGQLDLEPLAERGDHLPLHLRDAIAVALDLHRFPHPQLPLLDLQQ